MRSRASGTVVLPRDGVSMRWDDEHFMERALELARRPAFTSPNPRVGAVVVRDDTIIGEGAHAGAGTSHAETIALEGCDARGATLYVNLEPCVHEARTPPCAPVVVAAGVARAVVSTRDEDERVRGRGVAYLRDSGVEVTEGILEDEAALLNAPYLHQRSTGRSFLTLKLALSLDGRLAAPDGSSRWITDTGSRAFVHARRVEADAVMVGAGTVLADDPSLIARSIDAPRQPQRIILDATGRVPTGARLFGPGEVIVATTDAAPHEVQTGWKEAGAEVVVVPRAETGVDVAALLDALGRRGVVEVYCEGGAKIATYLLRHDLVNRLELHYGAVTIGDGGAGIGDLGTETLADARRWRNVSTARAGDTTIVSFLPQAAERT